MYIVQLYTGTWTPLRGYARRRRAFREAQQTTTRLSASTRVVVGGALHQRDRRGQVVSETDVIAIFDPEAST